MGKSAHPHVYLPTCNSPISLCNFCITPLPWLSYCSLLTRGANLQPGIATYPSTAPDALRHWTPAQKSLLEKSEKGKKLIDVMEKQLAKWRQKYDALGQGEKAKMTYEQFEWAMEAVNSRAFRGDFGGMLCYVMFPVALCTNA